MSSLNDKTFILGVGAQKAGTTWLYDYFYNRDDCFMSPLKELHYFDVKHRPDLCGPYQFQFADELLKMARSARVVDFETGRQLKELVDRVSMIYDETAYRRYFEERVPEGVDFFGEVTPSYAVLNPEGFKDARSQFGKIRVILILRDPIERHHSQMRMKERLGRIDSANDRFIEMLEKPGPVERSQYQETIHNLDHVFRPEEVYIGFYEQLFQDEELRKICEFVGLPFVPGQYEVRLNPAGAEARNRPLTPEQIAQARERFANVYAFCQERFGSDLPDNWNI